MPIEENIMPASDGWNYRNPERNSQDGKDCRKIVTLHEHGMEWVGIRAWDAERRQWLNNSEPERAEVHAWRDLIEPAKGWWDSGQLFVPTA